MKEKHTRSNSNCYLHSCQAEETSHLSNQIGNIFVTKQFKNGDVCLMPLDLNGARFSKAESIRSIPFPMRNFG